jgi:hypothetical protein
MIGSVDPVGTTGGAAAATCRRAEIGTLEIEDMPSIGSPCCDYGEAITAITTNTSSCAASASTAAATKRAVASGPANAVLAATTGTARKPYSVRKVKPCSATGPSGTSTDCGNHAEDGIAGDVAASRTSVATSATSPA